MSEVKVNKISPRTACGTTTLGDSGDIFNVPCGSKINLASGGNLTVASGATITNNGTQTGFGRTGTVDWVTAIKTTGFTAVSGEGYFCDTTSAGFTVTFPAASVGNIISISDYAGTFASNSVAVSPNGSDKIGGVNGMATLTTDGQSVTFVYADATKGWLIVQDSTETVTGATGILASGGTITTCGDYKIHTFTGPGTFGVVQLSPCAANNLVSHLVVAGGGSGGTGGGAGGGAGGFREVKSPSTPYTASPLDGYPSAPNRITISAAPYPITVGAGGAVSAAPAPPQGVLGGSGANSVFSTTTSAGGGGGGAQNPTAPTVVTNGAAGGSGGGGSYCIPGAGGTSPGGAGNTPPTTPSQGNAGGQGRHNGPTHGLTGGGGGAGAVGPGESPTPPYGTSNGGAGVTTSISATPTGYAGGGGGAGPCGTGTCGGGTKHTAGTDNTGGGGGGGGFGPPTGGPAGKGGSGIVIIRYKFQ